MANPYQFWNHQMEMNYERSAYNFTTPKKTSSPSSSSGASTPTGTSPSSSRKSSIRSYGQPFGAGVVIERSAPPSDDDLIIVVVRLSSPFRRKSLEPCEELPGRPPRRSFLKRLSTRWQGLESEDKYKAIKMPRVDYKRYFVRDKHGKYGGTEPERQWCEADVMREFSAYQHMPLRSILC
ncbi:hypothetical protein LTR85_007113 [Meristemomyces frigidus]|nr:hypothetical protein LTR85_007113 [Meristemomyces frigidus]